MRERAETRSRNALKHSTSYVCDARSPHRRFPLIPRMQSAYSRVSKFRIWRWEMCRKGEILDTGRFFFDYWHGTYVNRPKKMLFSHQLVDLLTANELEARIARAVPTDEWQFFCIEPPSEYVRKKVLQRYA